MKNRGIIKRLVFGKQREEDITEDDLPDTRVKLFKFVMRTRFGIIFRINLLAALFFIPFMVWDVLSGSYIANYVANMTAAEYFSNLIYLTLLRYGTDIPLIMIGCVGLAGLLYVCRRICWGEPVKILSDFAKGIKQSWKQFIFLGLLTGVVLMLVNYIVPASLAVMTRDNAVGMSVAMALAVLFAVVWIIAMMYAFNASSLYNITFGRLIISSMKLTFKRLFRNLGVCLLSLLPMLIFMFMPWAFVQIIGYCVMIVFSLGFAGVMQTVYCHGVFDEFINKYSYPDFVRMGMRGAGNIVYDEETDPDADGEETPIDSADGSVESEGNIDAAGMEECVSQSVEHDTITDTTVANDGIGNSGSNDDSASNVDESNGQGGDE